MPRSNDDKFCTPRDSRIGKLISPDLEVVRLTIENDLTTPAGLAKAIAPRRVRL